MTPSRPPAPSSRLVVVLLITALAVGAAASIVASARTASSPPVPGTPTTEVYLSDQVWIAACVLLFLAIAVPLVYDRIRGASTAIPGRTLVVTLTIVLVLILFVVAARFLGVGGGGFQFGPGAGNSTNNSTTIPAVNGNNTTIGNGGTLTFLSFDVPSWVLLPLIAVVGIFVAVVAVPRVRSYLQDRADSGTDSVPSEEVRGALGAAAMELAHGSDPRDVILRLYARLLNRVEPVAGNIDPATPEEIRSSHLVRLGIRPEAARALTRLFEEARYSTHALGPEAAARAAKAIAEAEKDLAREAPLP